MTMGGALWDSEKPKIIIIIIKRERDSLGRNDYT